MKTNEFIKAVEELGYEAEKDEGAITVTYKNKVLAHVFINELYRMSSYFSEVDCGKNAGVLFALIFQYAVTPIEDRKDKNRYYLRHKWLNDSALNYLQTDKENNYYSLSVLNDTNTWKTKFTEEEIEGIKEIFNTDLNDFEIVEVENEN